MYGLVLVSVALGCSPCDYAGSIDGFYVVASPPGCNETCWWINGTCESTSAWGTIVSPNIKTKVSTFEYYTEPGTLEGALRKVLFDALGGRTVLQILRYTVDETTQITAVDVRQHACPIIWHSSPPVPTASGFTAVGLGSREAPVPPELAVIVVSTIIALAVTMLVCMLI